jgi:predicted Ser/Thr protein kinase
VVECLGRGGMGVVYKARQKSLDRWVAIKILHQGQGADERFAARFEKEARTLGKMSHPNIVTVFDHGEAEGLYHIVMEFIDGVNVRDLLRDGKMEPAQALAIVPPICEALEYAHDKGVVHRDIKPENLLLDREGRVKIADFGIASLVGAEGERSGTPPYMAPEQGGGAVDRRADIYALGAVLYEMLTGERPGKDLVPPSRKVEIDVKLDEMVLRALEKQPERRYQTAEEFRTVVETIASPAGVLKVDAPAVVQAPASSDGARWKLLRVVSLAGVLGMFTALAGIIYLVKIVPGWENAWCQADMSLSSGQQLLLQLSHVCQKVWPMLVLALVILGAAAVAGYLIAVRRQPSRPADGAGWLSRRVNVGRLAAIAGGLGVTIWLSFFVAGKLSDGDRSEEDPGAGEAGHDALAEGAAAAGTDAIEATLDWRSVSRGLQFRIAPGARELGSEEREAYSAALETGRWGGRVAGGSSGGEQDYRWLPVSGELPNMNELVTNEHQGGTMVLVSEKPTETMLPGKGRNTWQVQRVTVVPGEGSPEACSIRYELNEQGAAQFTALTGANIERSLAIIVSGVVVSAPIIKGSLGKSGLIAGPFSRKEADRLAHALAGGDAGVAAGLESEPAREQAAPEEPPGARRPPSSPLDAVMASLQPLGLTDEQAGKIDQWFGQRGAAVNPAEFAEFVKSILRDDQQAAFEKIIESGGRPADVDGGGPARARDRAGG